MNLRLWLGSVLFGVLSCGLTACQYIQPSQPSAPQAPTATITIPATVPLPTPRPTITPTPPYHSPNGPPLSTLKFFTAQDGWGLINNSLLLTHDGGVNWFSVPMPAGQVDETSKIFFIDQNIFYLLVNGAGQNGQLYFTNNGGGSWQTNTVPFQNGNLTFVDNLGYFLETKPVSPHEMSVKIYTSVDNGLTWSQIFPGDNLNAGNNLPDEGLKTGISFIEMYRGWLGVANQPKTILLYKTENSGHNWLPQVVPMPENIDSMQSSTFPPLFFPGNYLNGLLPVDFCALDGNNCERIFYSTIDGGLSWTPGTSIPEGGPFSFINPERGWSWGRRGLFVTSDGAKTWQSLPVAFGPSEHAIDISFSDENTGFLLTADAKNRVRIYQSQDSGTTWIAINP